MIFKDDICTCEECSLRDFPCHCDCDIEAECIGCEQAREAREDIVHDLDFSR